MQTAFLTLVFCIGIADLAFSREMSIAPIALLYSFLKIQAELAAAKFLREGLKFPEPAAMDWVPPDPAPEAEVKTAAPFRKPLLLSVIPLEEAKMRRQASKPKQAKKPAPLPKAPFRHPNFSGQPHEILGITENAVTKVIQQAFRFWIKKYHPDHAQGLQQVSSATERSRQLTAAKESLLQKRQQIRKPKAA